MLPTALFNLPSEHGDDKTVNLQNRTNRPLQSCREIVQIKFVKLSQSPDISPIYPNTYVCWRSWSILTELESLSRTQWVKLHSQDVKNSLRHLAFPPLTPASLYIPSICVSIIFSAHRNKAWVMPFTVTLTKTVDAWKCGSQSQEVNTLWEMCLCMSVLLSHSNAISQRLSHHFSSPLFLT